MRGRWRALACLLGVALGGCDRSTFVVPVGDGASAPQSVADGGTPEEAPPGTGGTISVGPLALVAGRAFSCARRGESLGCWGDPFMQRALGVVEGGTIGSANFTVGGFALIPALRVRDVAAEGDGLCLVEDGQVLCTQHLYTGPNVQGIQPGCSSPGACLYELRAVGPLPEPALAVETSDEHACAITASGRVMCWGRNDHGQLGPREPTGQEPPCQAQDGLCFPPAYVAGVSDAVQISVSTFGRGFGTSCALTRARQIYCWGSNNIGQLGIGQVDNDSHPASLVALEARSISIGPTGGCAVGLDGRVLCWGSISGLNLGSTQNGPRAIKRLTEITAGSAVDLSGIVQVSRGANHACAVDVEGRVWCWGNNDHGELGRGRLATLDSICQVEGMAGLCGDPASRVESLKDVALVATGRAHTCAAGRDGSLRCWGSNSDGQVGVPVKNPEDARNFSTPTAVQGNKL